MPISTLPSAREFEEKDHAEVEFVGFRYIGDESTKVDRDIRQRVGYNGPPKFQVGRVYLALLPTYLDANHVENNNIGVHALESRSDFEVIYDPERLAEALLDQNYLPPEAFYEGFDRWTRQKVMEKLDLDDVGRVFEKDDEEPYRDQLRAIAGVETDDEASVSTQRSDEYTSRFSRSEASEIIAVLREAQASEPPFDPGAHTIAELEEELETDADEKWDVDSLNALYQAERLGDDRTGARNVLEDVLGDDLEPVDFEIDLESAGLTDMTDYLTRYDPAVVEEAADVVNGDAEISDLTATPDTEE
ncbi:hypothetical protein DVK05_09870 [Halorubrum sp. Atlit-8R]|uniref:hypothetical protein n=1 Tax=Halorubrum sp. Atlit-8R TaxID=2282126 RepID=UPI000EF28ADD|nr:hypothetical protein [Halorubrum sp. Atlit-8R]RLM81294.1 hypothetical protein DVK05_09870 [Halorubrum sp. Atlit-8R]